MDWIVTNWIVKLCKDFKRSPFHCKGWKRCGMYLQSKVFWSIIVKHGLKSRQNISIVESPWQFASKQFVWSSRIYILSEAIDTCCMVDTDLTYSQCSVLNGMCKLPVFINFFADCKLILICRLRVTQTSLRILWRQKPGEISELWPFMLLWEEELASTDLRSTSLSELSTSVLQNRCF